MNPDFAKPTEESTIWHGNMFFSYGLYFQVMLHHDSIWYTTNDVLLLIQMKEQPSNNTENINYNHRNGNDFRYTYSTQFSGSFQKIFSEVYLFSTFFTLLWSAVMYGILLKCICFNISQIFENEAENLTQDIQVVPFVIIFHLRFPEKIKMVLNVLVLVYFGPWYMHLNKYGP